MKKILLILIAVATLSSCSPREEIANSELGKKIQERQMEYEHISTKEEISEIIDKLIEKAGQDNNTIIYSARFLAFDKDVEKEAESIKNLIQEMDKRGYYLKEAIPTGYGRYETVTYFVFEKTSRYKLEDAIKEATQSFNP